MPSRLRNRVSPPTVVSTIVLFVALGGGYAVAFSGSGTLQKGSKTDLTGLFTSVRTLTGIGELQAGCDDNLDATVLRVRNTSGEDLLVKYTDEGGGAAGFADVGNGSTQVFPFDAAGSPGTTRIHIWPDDGSKAPQAEIVVSTLAPTGSDCAPPSTTSSATVLVLNTQQ